LIHHISSALGSLRDLRVPLDSPPQGASTGPTCWVWFLVQLAMPAWGHTWGIPWTSFHHWGWARLLLLPCLLDRPVQKALSGTSPSLQGLPLGLAPWRQLVGLCGSLACRGGACQPAQAAPRCMAMAALLGLVHHQGGGCSMPCPCKVCLPCWEEAFWRLKAGGFPWDPGGSENPNFSVCSLIGVASGALGAPLHPGDLSRRLKGGEGAESVPKSHLLAPETAA